MALSTSSSDGSAPELMTVPGRGRGMSTLVTSAAAAAAALVVRIVVLVAGRVYRLT